MINKKIAIGTAATAVLGLSGTAQAVPITAINMPGTNHYYELNLDWLNWSSARTEAQNRGGYLATINSAEENAFIFNNLVSTVFIDLVLLDVPGAAWLGGSDAESNGDWMWVDSGEGQFWQGKSAIDILPGPGAAFGGAYSNWAEGEPGPLAGLAREDSLAMINGGGGVWWDVNGNWVLPSVIEYVNDVPEPSTALLALLGLAGLGAGARRRKAA